MSASDKEWDFCFQTMCHLADTFTAELCGEEIDLHAHSKAIFALQNSEDEENEEFAGFLF